MSLAASLAANGAYTFSFTNDMVGACDGLANRVQAGTYEISGNTITFDES